MKINKKTLNRILEDNERLGPGVKMAPSRSLSQEEMAEIEKKAGMQMVSIRLPIVVVEQLKVLAKKDGLKYQPFVRRLLIQFATGAVPSIEGLTENRVREISSEVYKLERKREKAEKAS